MLDGPPENKAFAVPPATKGDSTLHRCPTCLMVGPLAGGTTPDGKATLRVAGCRCEAHEADGKPTA